MERVGQKAYLRARRIAARGVPEDAAASLGGRQQSRQRLERRALASAIGSEQSEHLSRRHVEGQRLHGMNRPACPSRAVTLAEAREFHRP